MPSPRALALGLLLLVPLAARGIPPVRLPTTLPESAEARLALRETIFAPLYEAARAASRVVLQPGDGASVLFRTERQNGSLYLEFVPGASLAGLRLDRAGTWVIKRRVADGAFLQAKVFLQNDPGCYLRLVPEGDRTAMEVVLFGETYHARVPLAAAFESLLTAPLARIQRLSAGMVDWNLLAPALRSGDDVSLEQIAASVRRQLPALRYVDDGALDGDGRWVFIRDGSPQGQSHGVNCSGFAKWFVDGFVLPLAGRGTEVAALRERGLAQRGNAWSDRWEEERDPWFGLDWSRNLAMALARARGSEAADPQQFDVRDVPGFDYVEDFGHPVASLATVLWLLSRRSAGAAYLGSINRPVGLAPQLRQHHHLVVLIPWVDASSTFRVSVFESGVETSLDSLRQRYAAEYIHLVRLESSGDFSPPAID